jgi:exopolysaccharide biosynthesis protein
VKRFFEKPYRFALAYGAALVLAVSLTLLDTFVIPRALAQSDSLSSSAITSSSTTVSEQTTASLESNGSAGPVITDSSYADENIQITISAETVDDTAVYVTDVQVSDISYLKAAFAEGTFGRNIKAATSEIAEENGAIFAINGDYYGFRNKGYVLRNGTLYRWSSNNSEDLVIDSSGNFSIIQEGETGVQALVDTGVWQIFSFGPALVVNGQITVTADSEVNQARNSNPRTAIGQVGPLHYVFVVSDGRTDESAGLSLLQLAQVLQEHGCTVAYNLDGGGSSTMWFNGQVVNNPTDGRNDGERSVSDIVYIGYEG